MTAHAAREFGEALAAGFLEGRREGEAQRASQARPRAEEVDDMDEEDDNEAMEDDNPNDQQVPDASSLDQLTLLYEAAPEDGFLRAALKAEIRKRYIDNGGLPINTKDPIPVDLEKLSPQELIFVAQNMQIFMVRARKDDIVSRFLNIFSNTAYLIARASGYNVNQSVNRAFASDPLIRDSFMEVFIGRTAQISPFLTLSVAGLSYLSNILVGVVDGQHSQSSADSSRIVIGGPVAGSQPPPQAKPGGAGGSVGSNPPQAPSTGRQ